MSIKNLYPTSDPDFRVDFVNGRRVPSEVRFTRDTIGTYVGRDGLIKTALPNEPRYTHDPVTGRELGLLVEEERTNFITYSQEFNNLVWSTTATNCSVSGANVAIGPDGALSAEKLIVNSGPATSTYINSANVIVTNGGIYTSSIYVKSEDYRYVGLFELSSGTGAGLVVFDLDTDTCVNSANGATVSQGGSVSVGNGWHRISYTYTSTSTDNKLRFYIYDDATSFLATGDGTKGVYLWGAQLEAGSFPTSYILTSGSEVTRSPDIATLLNSTGAIFDPGAFDIINQPFGVSSGSNELVFTTSAPVKSTLVYSPNLSQKQINTLASKTDEFWRWRVTGSSFGLPSFLTDGQVTVDWDDGTIETLTTSDHIFTDGKSYHEIGFRLDSGTYFRPYINDNANHDTKVVAIGPAPESMKLDGNRAFYGCTNLKVVDSTIDATGGTLFYGAWYNCSSLTNFPLIDTSSGTDFDRTWYNCVSLTSFPLINMSSGINFRYAWQFCNGLTSFPLIDTSNGTNFTATWEWCTSLTSFPLLDTSSGTNFSGTWGNCTGLTSFPLIDTSSGTIFNSAWYNCSSLTSFPLIDTSSGTIFNSAWYNCSSLTSFPLIDTSSGANFFATWRDCRSLTSFPSVNVSNGTTFQQSWYNCTSLTDFPANLFDSWTGTPADNCFVNAFDVNVSLSSSLTATSVENILNSIDTSGQSAPASGVDIAISYNASSGTPNISAAVTNLKSRGWTITLNGVAQ